MYFGLKWNPFSKNLPVDGMIVSAGVSKFCWRVENLVMDGGFALITGSNGLGKSMALRILEDRLSKLREVQTGVIQRPQSGLADFYREMGQQFGCHLSANNRWGFFRELRRKWQAHIESTLFRPVLLIDEAQEMQAPVLTELRFLTSDKFDSRNLLTVILGGDTRLAEKFSSNELQPLGSRIYTRLTLEPWAREDLIDMMHGLLDKAGNQKLITPDIIATLADHSLGNPRIMMNMAIELLMEAFKQQAKIIDEKIYMSAFNRDLQSGSARPKLKRSKTRTSEEHHGRDHT